MNRHEYRLITVDFVSKNSYPVDGPFPKRPDGSGPDYRATVSDSGSDELLPFTDERKERHWQFRKRFDRWFANHLGDVSSEGWQLVAFYHNEYVLVRPVQE